MPPGFRIKHIEGRKTVCTMGSDGSGPCCVAMSKDSATERLHALLADYKRRGIRADLDEYILEPLGDVPFVEGYPPPREPLPSCYRK